MASTSTPAPNASALDPEATTAIVLCGGRGRRLGGVDKPLLEIAGKPLVMHIVERLAPQVQTILISCPPATTPTKTLASSRYRTTQPTKAQWPASPPACRT